MAPHAKATGSRRFALYYDGGSIGQVPDARGILHPPKNDGEFRDACEPVIRQFQMLTEAMRGVKVAIDYFFRSTEDSINKTPEKWVGMAGEIQARQDEGYDAIGFCMGTDTAASAMGAVALQAHENTALRIPVGCSAAQLPIDRLDGDGTFNLAQLLKTLFVACEQNIADVMFNFSYEIFKAVRFQKKSLFRFDGFISPNFPTVGSIHSHDYGVDLDTRYLRTINNQVQPGRMDLITGFDSSGVHMIDLQPGYQAKSIEKIIADHETAVIILRTDGDYNVTNEEGCYNLVPVIHHATRLGVTVLLTVKIPTRSPVLGGPMASGDESKHAMYGPGQEALDAGAIACGDMTDKMVWVKALRGRAKRITDWKKYMETNIADEVDERIPG